MLLNFAVVIDIAQKDNGGENVGQLSGGCDMNYRLIEMLNYRRLYRSWHAVCIRQGSKYTRV